MLLYYLVDELEALLPTSPYICSLILTVSIGCVTEAAQTLPIPANTVLAKSLSLFLDAD